MVYSDCLIRERGRTAHQACGRGARALRSYDPMTGTTPIATYSNPGTLNHQCYRSPADRTDVIPHKWDSIDQFVASESPSIL
jgi:hypothetical protein